MITPLWTRRWAVAAQTVCVLLLALACAGCTAQPAAPTTSALATPADAATPTGGQVALPNVSGDSAPAATGAATPTGGQVALPNVSGDSAPAATDAATPTGGQVALPNVSGDSAPAATDAATPTGGQVTLPNVSGNPVAETPAATSTPASVIALPGVAGAPSQLAPDATVVPDGATTATIGEHTLALQVVASPETRAQGLMFYRELPQDTGMLFVFPVDGQLSFWMRNTLIPLSVAFLDADRRILNIADMQPLDDRTFHASAGPARYALEVNQGWFATRGIGPGAVVEFTLPADLAVR